MPIQFLYMQTSNKKSWIQFLKFLLFSISAGVIQASSFALLDVITPWTYWPCYLISLLLSVLWNFTFNRHFTFKDSSNVPLSMALVIIFYVIFTPLSTWWGDKLDNLGWDYYVILAMTMVINFITEFFYDKYVVFRHQQDKRNSIVDEQES